MTICFWYVGVICAIDSIFLPELWQVIVKSNFFITFWRKNAHSFTLFYYICTLISKYYN